MTFDNFQLEKSIAAMTLRYTVLGLVLLVGINLLAAVPDLLQNSFTRVTVLTALPDVIMYLLSAAVLIAVLAVLAHLRNTNQFVAALYTGRRPLRLYMAIAIPGFLVSIIAVLAIELVALGYSPLGFQGNLTWERTHDEIIAHTHEGFHIWNTDHPVTHDFCGADDTTEMCQKYRLATRQHTLPATSPSQWGLADLYHATHHLPKGSKLRAIAERMFWFRISLPLWMLALAISSCYLLTRVELQRSKNRKFMAFGFGLLIAIYFVQSIAIAIADAELLATPVSMFLPIFFLLLISLVLARSNGFRPIG